MQAGDAFVDVKTFSRERARPLAPDDRREAILDAVIPLLRARGRDTSSRQMAEAAGVAEGTLFRAFGDKESIIAAAVERVRDPEPFHRALREIDPAEPTEAKVRQVLHLLRDRFADVVGFMTALRMQGPPAARHRHDDSEWLSILDQVFHTGELAIPASEFGHYLRFLAFGSAIPVFAAQHPLDLDHLADLVLHGVLPPPSDGNN